MHLDGAVGRREVLAREDAKKRRFSRAVCTDQDAARPRCQLHIQPAENISTLVSSGVRKVKVFHLDSL